MVRPTVAAAAMAGFCAGLPATILQLVFVQLVFVQPVLLHAEFHEGGALVHFGAEAVSAHPDLPRCDPLRDMLSILFSVAFTSDRRRSSPP